MNKEKAQEMLEWLYKELESTSKEMKEARAKNEYTKQAHHEGRADALLRIINKIKSTQQG